MFGVFKTYKDVKKGIHDPGALGQDLALDVLKGPLILITFFGAVFFTALGVLAFSGLLGGPYVFFKVVFWLLLIPAVIIEWVLWALLAKAKKMLEKARKQSGVIDVTPKI